MSQKTKVQTALETLTEQTLEPGLFIPVKRFEEILGIESTSQEFGWLITAIRRKLHEQGLHLSGEGLSQLGGYTILDPQENFWIAKLSMERASRNLEDAQILLINTNMDGFSTLQRARHEATLQTVSLRLNALRKVAAHNRKSNILREKLLAEQEPED